MDIKQIVKDLQAQNSQFPVTLLTLAKGQQELLTLLVAKKKTKKKAFINMGKRFKGQVQIVEESSEEDKNQDEEARSTRDGGANNQASEDEDYFGEKYPLIKDKYKQLEDEQRLLKFKSCLAWILVIWA